MEGQDGKEVLQALRDEYIQEFKEEIVQILQDKLNNIHIEFAGSEQDYCKILGYQESLKFSIETIKNK